MCVLGSSFGLSMSDRRFMFSLLLIFSTSCNNRHDAIRLIKFFLLGHHTNREDGEGLAKMADAPVSQQSAEPQSGQ